MNLGGPADFDELFPDETVEQENYKLKNDLHLLSREYDSAVEAIRFLIAHCQKNNIDPFPEGPLSLQAALELIKSLKPEELKKRNDEVTKRIVPRCKNPESLKMKDAMENQKKVVEEFQDNPLITLLSEKLEMGGKRTITLQEYCDAVQGQEETNFIARTLLPHVGNELAKLAKP